MARSTLARLVAKVAVGALAVVTPVALAPVAAPPGAAAMPPCGACSSTKRLSGAAAPGQPSVAQLRRDYGFPELPAIRHLSPTNCRGR